MTKAWKMLHALLNTVVEVEAILLAEFDFIDGSTVEFVSDQKPGDFGYTGIAYCATDFQVLKVTMLPQRMKKVITDNPKKLANLIDLVNLPSNLREFVGQSQVSRLGCFTRVWSYIKENNLQDPNNKNVVNCDDKLKSILLGKPRVELAELPSLIKLHFPKEPR